MRALRLLLYRALRIPSFDILVSADVVRFSGRELDEVRVRTERVRSWKLSPCQHGHEGVRKQVRARADAHESNNLTHLSDSPLDGATAVVALCAVDVGHGGVFLLDGVARVEAAVYRVSDSVFWALEKWAGLRS